MEKPTREKKKKKCMIIITTIVTGTRYTGGYRRSAIMTDAVFYVAFGFLSHFVCRVASVSLLKATLWTGWRVQRLLANDVVHSPSSYRRQPCVCVTTVYTHTHTLKLHRKKKIKKRARNGWEGGKYWEYKNQPGLIWLNWLVCECQAINEAPPDEYWMRWQNRRLI